MRHIAGSWLSARLLWGLLCLLPACALAQSALRTEGDVAGAKSVYDAEVPVAVLSMGNPHAVTLVDDVDQAPVAEIGPLIEHHRAFPERVNAGFLQIVDRGHARLRVYERGAGETLACGTGACAAVVAGIRLGLLDEQVDLQARGGHLQIAWAGGAQDSVFMTGPADTVFEGVIDVPEQT